MQPQPLVNQFMNPKAGMALINQHDVAHTIQRLTAGSPKYIHEQEMQLKRSIQVAEMLNKCLSFSLEQKDTMVKEWWKQIYELRANRPLDRYWAHFDFDMFYVACQLLQKPQLKDKPCAVGGPNSVLSTANYEARKYGVRAAMPTFIAMELCPQLILLQTNFQKYKHFSNIFRQILSAYDGDLESNGLDEAYIDMTEHLKGKNTEQVHAFITQIRTNIFQATGLTVSCGVGPNKMLAKIASQERKPNDQFIVENKGKTIEQFMGCKKIRKIPGIGPVSEFYLKGLGIQTAKDILQNTDVLTICFSKQSTQFFISTALGLGSIQHSFQERKSIGKSQTFKATQDNVFLSDRLRGLCEQVGHELQELGYLSINSVLSYQTNNFQKRDKTFNLNKYTDSAQELFTPLFCFLKAEVKGKLRLLGVRCSAIIKAEDYKKQQILSFINNPKKLARESLDHKSEKQHIKSLMRDENSQIGKYLCPICNLFIESKGNVSLFNKHIDKCLLQPPNDAPQHTSPKIIDSSKPAPKKTQGKQKKEKKQKVESSPNLLHFLKKH